MISQRVSGGPQWPSHAAQHRQVRSRGTVGFGRCDVGQASFFHWGVRRGLQPAAFHRLRFGSNSTPNKFLTPFQQQQSSTAEQPQASAAQGVHTSGDEPFASAHGSHGSSPGHSFFDEPPGDVLGGKAGRLGPSAKQLLQTHLHSVESFEPSLGSLEDYSGFDTMEDARLDSSNGMASGVLHGKQASVATFEVGGFRGLYRGDCACCSACARHGHFVLIRRTLLELWHVLLAGLCARAHGRCSGRAAAVLAGHLMTQQ